MKTIDTLPVESSQIHSLGYDPETQTLAVRFKDRVTGAEADLYHYSSFTAENWDALINAESIGSHFYKFIRPFKERFPYVRIAQGDKA